MEMRFKIFVAALASLFSVALSSAAKVGEPAPLFSLVDTEGATRSLSDYAGKIVVLEWTNYGCPFVKKHYNSENMQGLQLEAKGKDVVWLSICSSAPGTQGHMSPVEWKAAIQAKGVGSTAVLLDESGEVGQLYGAKVTPHMYVIDATGTLVYDGAIDSIASTNPSDIGKADNFVTAAVDALLAGEAIGKSKVRPYGCGIKYARN